MEMIARTQSVVDRALPSIWTKTNAFRAKHSDVRQTHERQHAAHMRLRVLKSFHWAFAGIDPAARRGEKRLLACGQQAHRAFLGIAKSLAGNRDAVDPRLQ